VNDIARDKLNFTLTAKYWTPGNIHWSNSREF